jgi:protein phosphatase
MATDIGRARERNEDGLLVAPPLFAVADGMGGHRGGDVASRLALEALGEGDRALADRVREANRRVYERSMVDRAVAGMGTTLTAAVVEGDRLRLAHVGDSRAYLLRDGRLRRLTEDHTLVHRMVTRGQLTEEEAAEHPYRSVLTRALGTEPDVAVDEAVVEVRAGDRLLLCTDGLTGMVPEARVAEILRTVRDPQEAADRLVEEANEAGGLDNITVLVLEVEDGDPAGTEDAGTAAGEPTGTVVTPAPSPKAPRRAGTGRGPGLRRGVPRLLVGVAIAAAVAVLALAALQAYLDRQWFVAIADGRVAVFQGVPTSVAGFELHRVVLRTDIDAARALELPFYADLREGITADSQQQAMEIVEQIRRDVEVAERQARRDEGEAA